MATFIGAGDMMINPTEPGFLLQHVAGMLRGADLTYLNLEGPMCDVGRENPALTAIGMAVRSSPRVGKALQEVGVDVVSLANNHTMDYGAEGLEQTMELLGSLGIQSCGAGRNLREARRPAHLLLNGVRVAFLSYTSVCPPSYAATPEAHGAAVVRADTSYDANVRVVMQPGSPMKIRTVANADDLAMVQEDVRSAKTSSDVVFVAWHWGVSERHGRIAEYQRELGRAAIDAGADAILGHHAHMLLGIEFHRGRPIFYSMGNFVFDMAHHYFRPETVVVKCEIGRDGLAGFRLLPFRANEDRQPVPTDDQDTQRIAWMLEDLSEGLNTRITCVGREIELFPLN